MNQLFQFIHLTTLHSRTDTRIFIKETQTLANAFPYKIALVVSDGNGIDTSHRMLAVYDLGNLKQKRTKRAFLGGIRAFHFIRKTKPWIVHFHDPELIFLGLILKLFGYKVVYDVHEDVPRQILCKHWIPSSLRQFVALAMSVIECFAAQVFDAIVSATPKIADRFPPNKTVIVQNFPLLQELRHEVSIPYNDRPLAFTYLGGISAIRGAREMIEAIEQLHDQMDVRLELAGTMRPTSLETDLRALVGWRSVNYHGHVERKAVARLLGSVRAGLVLLHPTQNYIDAYPVKMFEYMAAGIPVIASDFPLWRQIIDGAECGLLVDPMNPQGIADAMSWILKHPAEAEAMGRRGHKAIEEMYNWDHEAANLIALYKKLLTTRN